MGLLLLSQQSLSLSNFYKGTLGINTKHEDYDILF